MSVTFSRISELSRLSVCPSAAVESADKPAIDSDATAFGSAGHAWLERMAPSAPTSALVDLAREFQCDPDALIEIVHGCTFNPGEGHREAEVTLVIPEGDGCPEIMVPGHVDWYAVKDGTVEVWDYKFSRFPKAAIPIERDAQWHGYAVALADQNFCSRVTGGKYFPVLGEEGYEKRDLDPGALASARDWLTFVVRRYEREAQKPLAERTYRPSQWDWSTGCKGCPGIVTCDAARFEQQRALALIGQDPKSIPDITCPEDAVALYEARTAVGATQRASTVLGHALRDYVDEHGPVDLDDKRELRVIETKDGKRFVQACRKVEVIA